MWEADRLLDRLEAAEPDWASRAALPQARAHLRLGAISPDLQWFSRSLGFGHSLALSYHLLDRAAAQGDDLRLLFSLGHLAHSTSDPAGECFVMPTLFGGAPVGLFDLFAGDDDALGESETLYEGLGDLIIGDWHALVDLLYDMWMDGEAAQAQALDVLDWYCREGAAFHGRGTDCPRALDEIATRLAQAEPVLGNMDRGAAHDLVGTITALPPANLLELFGSGALSALLGEVVQPSADFARERERFAASPAGDRAFWARYLDGLDELGPSFALDALTRRPLEGWPSWDPPAIVCGNIQSVLQFLPEAYRVRAGLLVDELEWLDPDGHGLAQVSAALAGATLQARLLLYSAVPLEARLRGVVRKDRPGLDPVADEVLGEATLELAIDPARSMITPRTELTIPFVADREGALGYYVELYLDDEELPTFTTCWDRLWAQGALDLDRPIYRDNFGTYGHWPPSLPVADPEPGPAVLLVKVQLAPRGGPIAGAEVVLDDGAGPPLPRLSAPNGLAVFDALEPGPLTLSAMAAGHAPSGPVPVVLGPLEQRWLELPLHAIPLPQPAAAWWPDGACLPFTWNAEAFADQAEAFLARAELGGEGGAWSPLGEEVELDTEGTGELCLPAGQPDGSRVRVRLQARYTDGSPGVEGSGPEVVLDGSPPQILAVELAEDDPPACLDDSALLPYTPPLVLRVELLEPHCPVAGVRWRLGEDAPWSELVGAGPADDPTEAPRPDPFWLSARIEGGRNERGEPLWLQAVNAAGLSSLHGPLAIPVWDEGRLCPPEDAGVAKDAGEPDGGEGEPDGGEGVPDGGEGVPDGGVPADAGVAADAGPEQRRPAGGSSDGGGGGCAMTRGGGGGASPGWPGSRESGPGLLLVVALLLAGRPGRRARRPSTRR